MKTMAAVKTTLPPSSWKPKPALTAMTAMIAASTARAGSKNCPNATLSSRKPVPAVLAKTKTIMTAMRRMRLKKPMPVLKVTTRTTTGARSHARVGVGVRVGAARAVRATKTAPRAGNPLAVVQTVMTTTMKTKTKTTSITTRTTRTCSTKTLSVARSCTRSSPDVTQFKR